MATVPLKREVSKEPVTDITPSAPAELAPVGTNPLIQGEVTAGDFAIPRLALSNKSGELGNTFEPGSFVLDKRVIVGGKDFPLIFTVTHARRLYEEVTDPNEGRMGERVNTAAEVRAKGGEMTFGKADAERVVAQGKTPFRDVADLGILIEAPKDLSEEDLALFPYEFEGKQYGPAIYTCRSASYNVARSLFFSTTGRHSVEKGGWTTGDWQLTAALIKKGSMSWFSPVLKPGKLHSPAFAAWAKALLS
jgi:hypothetical protein